jgi:hypothetical protein
VAIHANLSQTRIFWLEAVRIPSSAIWIDQSRTVRASFSSAKSAWHVIRLRLKDDRFDPCLERAPKKTWSVGRDSAPLWSVFFVAADKHCHATSFAAIMCPEHCIVQDPRGNGGRQLVTSTTPRLVQSLPKGTRVEKIESTLATRMVTVMIPPRSTRPVSLVAGERDLSDLKYTEYPRASQCPKTTLQHFAKAIPWRNGGDLVKEMPPANVFLGPRVLTPPTLIAPQEYPEGMGNYHTLRVVRRSPAFGPPEQPMERDDIITSGRADAEYALPTPSRRGRQAFTTRVGPET